MSVLLVGNICCDIHSFSFSPPGFHGTEFRVFETSWGFIFAFSMLLFLVLLNRRYKDAMTVGYNYFLRPLMGLQNPEEKERSWVLPVYYSFAQVACIWFVVECLAYLASGSQMMDYIGYIVFCVSAFIDNVIMIFLCFPTINTSSTVSSVVVSFFLSACYMIFVAFVPKESDCKWCGIHFPTSYIAIPYAISAVFYLAISLIARFRPFDLPVRPAAFIWGLFLTIPYGVASFALLLLAIYDIDFGYCMLLACLSFYIVCYPFVLYRTITSDSLFCLQHNRVQGLLDPVEIDPLLQSEEGMSDDIKGLLKEQRESSVPIIKSIELKVYERIGVGGFGEVYRGTWCGTTIAIKKLFVFSLHDEEKVLEDFLREVNVLSKLRHPNILLLVGVCIDSGNQALITEYMNGGSVWDLIHRQGDRKRRSIAPARWDESFICNILLQTAKGVCYLHGCSPMILHRDLKSQNLLIDKHYNLKIADFGISRIKDSTMTRVGTVQWTAPEVLRDEAYTEKIDVYSFAIIIWEMLYRETPYMNMNTVVIAQRVAYQRLRPSLKCSRVDGGDPLWLTELMKRCWAENPAARPNFLEIIEVLETNMALSGHVQRRRLSSNGKSTVATDFEEEREKEEEREGKNKEKEKEKQTESSDGQSGSSTDESITHSTGGNDV